jgi:TorA maturation chaperone TorD
MLSDCYFLPDPGLSEKLENLELNMSDVCEPAAEWAHSMRKEFEGSANLEPLKIDFSKLFVGPYKLFAAPYGSVYLDGERQVMGDSTLDVKNRYREAGLDTAKNTGKQAWTRPRILKMPPITSALNLSSCTI